MVTNKLHVIIDTREPAEIKKWLPLEFKDVKFTFEALREGDFMTEHVLVERKRIDDLYHSKIGDGKKVGRLDDQRARLSTHQGDKIVIFLITDDIDEWIAKEAKYGKVINRSVVDGIIASLVVRDDFRVIMGAHEHGALRTMISLFKKIELLGELNIPAIRHPDSHMAKLLDIPLTDWLTCKSVYGTSLKHLASLSPKDFEKLHNWGKVKSKKVHNILQHGF